jgi:hypothetical protein
MDRITQNSLAIARWLETLDWVEFVNYPGLESSPHYVLAKKYLKRGFGGVLTFKVKGGQEVADKIVNNVKLISHLANIATQNPYNFIRVLLLMNNLLLRNKYHRVLNRIIATSVELNISTILKMTSSSL